MYKVMEEIEEVVGDKTTVEADDLDNMNQVKNMPLCTYVQDYNKRHNHV